MAYSREKIIHMAFDIGVWLKGINALVEFAAGLALIFADIRLVQSLLAWTVHGELTEDPADPVAGYILQSAQSLSIRGTAFISIYLLSHGLIKALLVASLLKRKLWAYPAAIAVFGLFIIYQLYELARGGSLWFAALSAFDAVIIALTWHEYRMLKRTGLRTVADARASS
jgi:uncharacterized membrane protein